MMKAVPARAFLPLVLNVRDAFWVLSCTCARNTFLLGMLAMTTTAQQGLSCPWS